MNKEAASAVPASAEGAFGHRMSRRIYTADAGMALLAVALVVAFALAHCADLIGAPTDAQADADTAASMADAIAAARATDHHARAVRVAAAPH